MRKTDFRRRNFAQEDRFVRQIFDKADTISVSIHLQETAQITASGFLKHSEETGLIPDCSFYLAVLGPGMLL